VPSNLPFLLDHYRVQWAKAALGKVKAPPLNTDLNPVAYFYLWKMWLTMFVSPAALTGLALLAAAFAIIFTRLSSPAGPLRDGAAAGVFMAGFWAMGFEVVCLFLFQNFTGQLSWKMGVLFAGFMAGSSAGAYAVKLIPISRRRVAAVVAALALSAGLWRFAPRLGELPPAPLFTLFMALLFCGGLALGGYFAAVLDEGTETAPYPGRQDRGVKLYYSHLLGAAVGGFVFSAALIPLAGLRASLLWAAGAMFIGALL
jgi:hypothetical protein